MLMRSAEEGVLRGLGGKAAGWEERRYGVRRETYSREGEGQGTRRYDIQIVYSPEVGTNKGQRLNSE